MNDECHALAAGPQVEVAGRALNVGDIAGEADIGLGSSDSKTPAFVEQPTPFKSPFFDFPGNRESMEMTGIDLDGPAGYVGRRGEGRKPIDGPAGKLSVQRQDAFEEESIRQILD